MSAGLAGEASTNAAQSAIDGQIKAFLADDSAAGIFVCRAQCKRIFPSVDAFMNMVTRSYEPVWKPQKHEFGKSVEIDDRQILQQVLVIGPDGKNYEAV